MKLVSGTLDFSPSQPPSSALPWAGPFADALSPSGKTMVPAPWPHYRSPEAGSGLRCRLQQRKQW